MYAGSALLFPTERIVFSIFMLHAMSNEKCLSSIEVLRVEVLRVEVLKIPCLFFPFRGTLFYLIQGRSGLFLEGGPAKGVRPKNAGMKGNISISAGGLIPPNRTCNVSFCFSPCTVALHEAIFRKTSVVAHDISWYQERCCLL
jgi:hypothetical protein